MIVRLRMEKIRRQGDDQEAASARAGAGAERVADWRRFPAQRPGNLAPEKKRTVCDSGKWDFDRSDGEWRAEERAAPASCAGS